MHIKASAGPGCEIRSTVLEAIRLCGEVRSTVPISLERRGNLSDFSFEGDNSDLVTLSFEFNGVIVSVMVDSDPELIYRDWSRALSGKIDTNVGPHPSPKLSDEEKESDARIEAENERRRQQRQSEYEAEAKARRDRAEARLVNAPAMEFSNKDAWDAATSQIAESMYGTSIATYAERWARLMQLELSEGKTLDEVWNSSCHEADLEGMSGYSLGIATHLLTETWVHGAELRKLHNAFWGSDSEDGTVNPAIITIGTD